MAIASRSDGSWLAKSAKRKKDEDEQGKLSWELELMAPQPLLRAE